MIDYQPVPAPSTQDEYEALLAAGVLIDVGGAPLVPRPCETCDGHTVGSTCPQSIDCPRCAGWSRGEKAGTGGRVRQRCMRPSGHESPTWCADRVDAAAAIDDERIAAGDLTVPARWPPAKGKPARRFVQESLL